MKRKCPNCGHKSQPLTFLASHDVTTFDTTYIFLFEMIFVQLFYDSV